MINLNYIRQNQQRIGSAILGMWGTLGIYRGHTFYVNDKSQNRYYYITDFIFSLFIGGMYVFPPFVPAVGIYELYKLEEVIRGIDDKKNK